jgi:hypothetical protein
LVKAGREKINSGVIRLKAMKLEGYLISPVVRAKMLGERIERPKGKWYQLLSIFFIERGFMEYNDNTKHVGYC